MAKLRYTHNSFSSGVIDPEVQGNVNFDGYSNSLSDCVNFQPMATGGLFKRPGTTFIGDTFAKNTAPKLVTFEFGINSNFILEVGLTDTTVGADRTSYIAFYGSGNFLGNEVLNIPQSGDTTSIVYASYRDRVLYCNLKSDDIANLKPLQYGKMMFFLRSDGMSILELHERRSGVGFYFSWDDNINYTASPMSFMNKTNVGIMALNSVNSSEKANNVGKGEQAVILRYFNISDHTALPDERLRPGFSNTDISVEHAAATATTPAVEAVSRHVALTYNVVSSDVVKYDTTEPTWFVKITGIKKDERPAFGEKGWMQAIGVLDRRMSPREGKEGDCHLPTIMQSKDTVPYYYSDCAHWRKIAFGTGVGYPKAFAIFEGRLFLAGSDRDPLGLWGSSTFYDDLFNFSLGSKDGDGLQGKAHGSAKEILWMASHNKLFIGTANGIYVAGSSVISDTPLTPKTFSGIRLFNKVGASPLLPIVAHDAVFFVDKTTSNLHEIVLSEGGIFRVFDLSMLSRVTTESGIISHAWQQNPIKTYYGVLNNGNVAVLTYLKNNNIVAWSTFSFSDGMNAAAKVLNVAACPGMNHDSLWMVLERRRSDGTVYRCLETMSPVLSGNMDSYDFNTLDSSLHFHNKINIEKVFPSVPMSTDILKSKVTHASLVESAAGPVVERTMLLHPMAHGVQAYGVGVPRHVIGVLEERRDRTAVTFKADVRFIPGLSAGDDFFIHSPIAKSGTGCYLFDGTPGRPSAVSVVGVERRVTPHLVLKGISGNYLTDPVLHVAFENSGLKAILTDGHHEESLDYSKCGIIFKLTMSEGGRGEYFLRYSTRRDYPSYDDNSDRGTVVEVQNISGELNSACVVYTLLFHELFYVSLGFSASVQLSASSGNFIPDNYRATREKLFLAGLNGLSLDSKWFDILDYNAVTRRVYLSDASLSSGSFRSGVRLDSSDLSGFVSVSDNQEAFRELKGTYNVGTRFFGKTLYGCGNGSIHLELPVNALGEVNITENNIFSLFVGLPVKGRFRTVPFFTDLVTGSSDGAVNSQRAVTIKLYRSLGGKYGADYDIQYPIKYVLPKDQKFDYRVNLYSQTLSLPMGGLKATSNFADMTVAVTHDTSEPFAVLSIARDVEISQT